ncbi:hypothetical protein Mal15_13650 [Stieleria maiorica]|uniref:Uncharacterized protein n=1 Tax=Stieleria maiorica TaxID=2795974 RepID=A0A5B9MCV6_9BACT|nr:hypothetical protein [Stieleria maiorica]QEF97325.1 hypothetical protein Mal15_13650 [Stieleria maiorica]
MRNGRPYLCCLVAISVAWVIGMLASWSLAHSGVLAVDVRLLLMVGMGSGAVAVAGGLPGIATEMLPQGDRSPARITIGFSAGAIIRLLGTVALVGLCSYHLPAAKKEIAGVILAWYVYLTSTDVVALAMLLPRQDRCVAKPVCLADPVRLAKPGRPPQEAK